MVFDEEAMELAAGAGFQQGTEGEGFDVVLEDVTVEVDDGDAPLHGPTQVIPVLSFHLHGPLLPLHSLVS